jgi:adenine phosphoribosyltransferase
MTVLCLRKFFSLQIFALAFANFPFANFACEECSHQSLENIIQESSTRHSTWILDYVHPVADFPKAGIQFQWYAHLLREPEAFARAINEFAERYRHAGVEAIAGLDSRGFIFGATLAYELKVPFVLIRKPGKLPGNVEKIDYELEYGRNSFEIERDSFHLGQKVLVIDDVLATGGTVAAACALVERLGAEVIEVACLIELPILKGRERVPYPVFSLIAIDVE